MLQKCPAYKTNRARRITPLSNLSINVSINYEQTVTTFYEIMTEHCSNQIKNIMQAQIETSASALGS